MTAAPPRAPSVAARAALVVLLLVLFYVLALAALVGLVAISVLAFQNGLGTVTGKLALVTVFIALALGRAVFAVERGSRDDLPGHPVSRQEEPALWAVVDEVAAGLGTPAPDELRLVDDVNAFVSQDSRFLGLLAGRRTMAIGVALLHCVDAAALRAVLAHEYGHFTGGDTRLGPLSYRATATVRRAVEHLGPRSPLGRLFGLYAVLVYRTSLAVRRRQEVSADLAAARLVGRETHESALRSVHAGAVAYGFFLERYVEPLLDQGVRPADLYQGFAALLADPERQQQLGALRDEVDAAPADPYDSHPSLGQRLAALQALPPGEPVRDARQGVELLADRVAVCRRTTDELLAHLDGTTVVDTFDEAAPVFVRPFLEAGQAALAAVPEVDGGPRPAGLGRALDLVAAGRGPELVVAFTRDRRTADDPDRDVADTLALPLAAVAEAQLVDRGAATYALSWTGPVHLVDASGQDVSLDEEVHAALLEPARIPELRRLLTRRGVDLGLGVEGGAPPAERDDVTLVLPAARIDGARGARADLLFTHEALLVAQYAEATSRAAAMRRAYAEADQDAVLEAARERLRPLREATPAQIAELPGVHRYLWDDLEKVVVAQGAKDGRTYALSIQPQAGGDPLTLALVDSPVHHDEVLERVAIAVGGERLHVAE